MNRILFLIGLFFMSIQIALSDSVDSLKWIKMPVKTYPDYPVQIHYIDSSCFHRHKKTNIYYTSSAPFVKKGRTIKVRCKNKTYKFKDSSNEGEQEYFVDGSYNNWIIIKAYLYYNYEQFYLINVKSGEIDSLAGEPLFYDNKILCIEGDNTDGTKMIEVWQFMDEKLSLLYSADLKRRRIYNVDDSYLRDDTVFLKTGERYLKLYHRGPWGTSSTNQGFQPYKYNGKELDRVHGLDWYDYGARRYDPTYCLFTQMDPLAEKYPHLSPYAYCAGNPVRYVDPDGQRIYMLFYTEGNRRGDEMFKVAAETRRDDIINRSDFDPYTDKVILQSIQDLGQLEGIINRIIDDYSEDYGQTAEFSIWSHAGIDGPTGTIETSQNAIDGKQMSMKGWSSINFNWGDQAIAGFYGCRTGVGNNESPSFVTRLSSKRNFRNVPVYGQTSSAYPSTNLNNRTTTRDIIRGHFTGHIYMVGGNRLTFRNRFIPSISSSNPWRKSINGKGYNTRISPY